MPLAVIWSFSFAGLPFDSPLGEQERGALQFAIAQNEEGMAVPLVDGRLISPEEVRDAHSQTQWVGQGMPSSFVFIFFFGRP